MRKITLIAIAVLIAATVWAQSPAKMSYQAVIRDASNALVAKHGVGMRISILQGSVTGPAVYSETQTPTTNANGLISIEVGGGAGFDAIDWAKGPYFIKTETDPTGGTSYTITGVSEFLSVPYALFAANGKPGPQGPAGKDGAVGPQGIPGINGAGALLPPTVTTLAATNLQSAPTLNGIVNANGFATVVHFEWGLTTGYGEHDTIHVAGNSPVAVNKIAEYLSPNTTYHYRVKATNPVGVAYGGDMTFTTTVFAPKAGYTHVGYISQTSASTSSSVYSDGGSPITARGVCWSTTPTPTLANSFTSNGTGEGDFGSDITGLIPGTKYYVRAYATNANGTGYGDEVDFTTATGLADIQVNQISAVSSTSVSATIWISGNGTSPVTASGVCWSTTVNPTIASNKTTNNGSGMGQFTAIIDGLTPGVTYYVRAYATNSLGTVYSNQVSFATRVVAMPTISTREVSDITQTHANSGGNVIDNGGGTITARGVCLSITANPTIADSKYEDGQNGQTTFYCNLNGLTPSTTYYVRAYVTNSVGTAYGNQVSFATTAIVLPTVTTNAASAVGGITAQSGGNVTDGGGAEIIARGVCWSKTANPTVADSKTEDQLYGPYGFNSILSGLTENTTYYVRAYATNSKGTAYGNQVSFTTTAIVLPTVTTKTVSNITQTTAQCGGDVTADGGASVSVKGVCWSTSQNPTTADGHTVDDPYNGSYNPQNYTSSIVGLTVSTTYYVRAYATNSKGTAYGNQVTFTTPAIALPTITTTAAYSITGTTARSGGNISNDGGAGVTAGGVCWSTSANPTIADSKTTYFNSSFYSNLVGLTENTTYYVRAYATNSVGTAYGNEISFTTPTVSLPILTTTAVSNLSTTTAQSGGYVASTGSGYITDLGVCWSTSANPTIANSKTKESYAQTFTSGISGLTENTTYYVRAYATNSKGTAYGNQVNFTTTAITLPTITTAAASSITGFSARSGGNISNDGGATVTERGVCWSTLPSPTTASNKVGCSYPHASFEVDITGLAPSTTYYVRAYAVNTSGISYGEQKSFKTTMVALATVSAPVVSNITTSSIELSATVTNDGGGTISEGGFCYSLKANPTIVDLKVGGNVYSKMIGGSLSSLTKNTVYHVRAYVINEIGISYSSDVIFTTATLDYVLFSGYKLFYNTTINSAGMAWGGSGIATPLATSFSDGKTNTTNIVSKVGANGGVDYAAKLCNDLVQDGYSDWYLPSLNELKAIPVSYDSFWTSTSNDATSAYSYSKVNGSSISLKTETINVQCVRKE